MDKLIIPLNGKTESEIQNNMIFSSMNWDSLMPTISEFARLRMDEVVEGIIADGVGLRVVIGRKRKQRTTKTVEAK